jgi:hypothetical protein
MFLLIFRLSQNIRVQLRRFFLIFMLILSPLVVEARGRHERSGLGEGMISKEFTSGLVWVMQRTGII